MVKKIKLEELCSEVHGCLIFVQWIMQQTVINGMYLFKRNMRHVEPWS